jgi:hypothetical protein
MAYDNTNRGSIWKNDRKAAETHADFAGTINVEGVDYWLNGWLRKADAKPTAPSMSFTVKRKEQQANNPTPENPGGGFRKSTAVPPGPDSPATAADFADDNLPF